ncbi:MAG: hypothetical protein FJ278_09345 [Planctomycetes bacterium]|nr:hypothetical protein [Planctomycetota bacterium]
MCVLAGHLGTKPAAAILLDLLEKQEGLAGGYYTGVATIHDGQIHYRKVVGDVAALRRETDAESLPGVIGIGHSRTPSGGDVEWAHPFIDCTGRMAYVAQGSRGFFEKRVNLAAAGDELLAKGHRFRSASVEKVGAYPVLRDGQCVHISDILCHAVEDARAKGSDLLEAMRRAYMRWPGEIVGMAIHADDPEGIVATCVNQPLTIGRNASETFLASTGLAFPDSISWRMPVPPNSALAIRRDGLDVRPFDATATPVDVNGPRAKAEAAIFDLLARKPGATWGAAYSSTKPLWPAGQLNANTPMAYEILERLCRSNLVRLETVRVPGMFNRGAAPQVRLYLI